MLLIGRVLIGIGVALIGWAFLMNVSVPDPSGQVAYLANNDLMNQRLLFAVAGTAAFLGGWLALLLRAISRLAAPAA